MVRCGRLWRGNEATTDLAVTNFFMLPANASLHNTPSYTTRTPLLLLAIMAIIMAGEHRQITSLHSVHVRNR